MGNFLEKSGVSDFAVPSVFRVVFARVYFLRYIIVNSDFPVPEGLREIKTSHGNHKFLLVRTFLGTFPPVRIAPFAKNE